MAEVIMTDFTLEDIRRVFREELGTAELGRPDTDSEADDTADGSFSDAGLLSKRQLRKRAEGKHVAVNLVALSFAKSKATRVAAGLETIEDIDDRPGELLDGDNIFDFMAANPQHYGTAWQENPANARPTYDD